MPNESILNIGIIAHVDAGKTTLTEQILYQTGQISRAGRVDLGTAQTDYMDVERQRGISVRAATTVCTWKGVTINLIDTPGHVDFIGEVERSLRVLDAAILCLSAVEGVQGQSEQYAQLLRLQGIPVITFINKIDRVGADPKAVLAQVKTQLGLSPIDFSDPDTWLPLLAEEDEALLQSFAEDRPVSGDCLLASLKRQMKAGKVTPYAQGSALSGEGVDGLLDLLITAGESPPADPKAPAAALIYKIEHDDRLGRVAHLRLHAGTLQNRDLVTNVRTGSQQKIVQIRKARGRKTQDVGRLQAGDIAAVLGLGDAHAGDVLGDAKAILPAAIPESQALLRVRLRPDDEKDYAALVQACEKLQAEEPKLDLIWQPETRDLLLHVTGRIQMEILQAMFGERLGLGVTLDEPQVVYRETPQSESIGFDAYTMPKPCWAIVKFRIEPLPPGSGIVYESQTPDTHISYRYQGQVEQSIRPALRQGPRGWPVTDLKITLIDGEDHPVHTHPLDFVTVTPIALMKGLVAAGTQLLEPFQSFWLSAPTGNVGKLQSEILRRRGLLEAATTPQPDSPGRQWLCGVMPVATSLDFPTVVAQITGGRGVLRFAFRDFRPCPPGEDHTAPYRGVNPLDRDRYLLSKRGALK